MEPITDEAAEVGELPETANESRGTRWYQFTPAAICVAIPIVLVAPPAWSSILRDACADLSSQSAMIHLIDTGGMTTRPLPGWSEAFGPSALRGIIAFLLAILLALTSVFKSHLKRSFRIGAFMESGVRPLRLMQSGHPGDYVLWLTIGLATLSAASVLLLRQ